MVVEAFHVRDEALDDESTAWLEMVGDILEALDLALLAEQPEHRVEDEVDEGEGPVDVHVVHVADRDTERRPTRLGAELGHHFLGDVDSRDLDTLGRQRQSDTPRADCQFKSSGRVSGVASEELDHRVLRLGGELVVSGGPETTICCLVVLTHVRTLARSSARRRLFLLTWPGE